MLRPICLTTSWFMKLEKGLAQGVDVGAAVRAEGVGRSDREGYWV